MKTLKEGGLAEVRSLKNRVSRALGRGKISKATHDQVWEKLDGLEILMDTIEEEDD